MTNAPTHFTVADIASELEIDISDAQHLVSTVPPISVSNGVSRWLIRDIAPRYAKFCNGYIPNPNKFTAKEKMLWNSGTARKLELQRAEDSTQASATQTSATHE